MVASRSTCGSYTKEMLYKKSTIQYYGAVCLLLAVLSCTNRQTAVAKLLLDPANGLLQVKTNKQHSIIMEVIPNNTNVPTGGNTETGFLRIKLALRSNEKIKGNAMMQYMNFGIRNSICAVQGADSLPCIVCERIPGLSEKEFLYLVFFNKVMIQNNREITLRLLITDTIAGFGTTVFDIKKEALKKIEAIK